MAAYSTRVATVIDGTGSILYVGQALIGSNEASPVWRIKRITDTGSLMKVEFAGGTSGWTSKWADHLTLSYS